MLSMTLADGFLELSLAERRLTIDVAAMSGAMLATERSPCGRVGHALVLSDPGGNTTRIDGSLDQLGMIHQRVIELLSR